MGHALQRLLSGSCSDSIFGHSVGWPIGFVRVVDCWDTRSAWIEWQFRGAIVTSETSHYAPCGVGRLHCTNITSYSMPRSALQLPSTSGVQGRVPWTTSPTGMTMARNRGPRGPVRRTRGPRVPATLRRRGQAGRCGRRGHLRAAHCEANLRSTVSLGGARGSSWTAGGAGRRARKPLGCEPLGPRGPAGDHHWWHRGPRGPAGSRRHGRCGHRSS